VTVVCLCFANLNRAGFRRRTRFCIAFKHVPHP
jgi:hypothetical protein